ncbi:MAG TPA: KH domain-containing protein [Candidatus Nanoarchaeia archaeon]|nr:KH domain-containing protein [Candidatus Nanoarchaeia archaeon]
MKTIYSEKLVRILKNKKRLQELLNVKISNKGRDVTVEGEAEDEYIAEKVIEAINFGFPYSTAISIKVNDNDFEVVNIKDYTKRKDLAIVKGRIVGKKGKTIQTISLLTNCSFEIKDNLVGIIGQPEYIKNAQEAISSLIRGSKQANVYTRLEKEHYKEPVDLGFK